MKRYNNLFEKVCDLDNIHNAIQKASKGKKHRASVIKVLDNEDYYAGEIRNMLLNGTYIPSPYVEKKILDGSRKKERIIYKPRFYPDQVVHWALMLQIEPILSKRMYYYSCASIRNKGSKLAVKGTKKAMAHKGTKYCLKLDVRKFYPSIDQKILKEKFRKVFKDKDLLWLIDTIIDSHKNAIGGGVTNWQLYLAMVC